MNACATLVLMVAMQLPAAKLFIEHVDNNQVIHVGDEAAVDYRVRMNVTLGEKGIIYAQVDDLLRVAITRDAKGRYLIATPMRLEDGKWSGVKDDRTVLYFRPRNDKTSEAHWRDRPFALRVDVTQYELAVWVDGMLAGHRLLDDPFEGEAVITLPAADTVSGIKVDDYAPGATMHPIDLAPMANATADLPEVDGGATFERIDGDNNVLSLADAQWVDQPRDPQSYVEEDDGGPYVLHDPRMPFLRVPKLDYVAVHALAYVEDAPGVDNVLSIRAGRYGQSNQVVQRNFMWAVNRDKPLHHVVFPMREAFAQDLLAPYMEMELTKRLRLARHVPDPNRFRYRPLGLPSGVRIAALTLERSPLQLTLTSDHPAHAFVEPITPKFTCELNNITGEVQPYRLEIVATHRTGPTRLELGGVVQPHSRTRMQLPLHVPQRGYYDLDVKLSSGDRHLLTRTTSFAVLMPNNRKHVATSPFGTWTWGGQHVTSPDIDAVGTMLQNLGMRYGLNTATAEQRAKYGLRYGFEPKIEPGLERYGRYIEKYPDLPDRVLIFHEDSISGPHVTRVPDLFHDRPPYQLNEKEQARYEKMLAEALGAGRDIRKHDPKLHVKFGNGPVPTKEQFFRDGFPAELFDSAGCEPGNYGRMPEKQPPDWVAHNAAIWMDRQVLDAYGYTDKPVTLCYETGYPGTNPGNLSLQTQAAYLTRIALLSMAWEMPFIHIGCLVDVGNSYYHSNWGSSGMCRAYPEMNVKPSYVAMATLTGVLDGAKFDGAMRTGSPSVYALRFALPGERTAVAMWTLRGTRPATLRTSGGAWQHVTDDGTVTGLGESTDLDVRITTTPTYVVGFGAVRGIELREALYDDAPSTDATVIAPLDSMRGWRVENDRDGLLESYNFNTPRRKGDFAFEAEDDAWRVTPRPIAHGKDTMPMYAAAVHETGFALPGRPQSIGVHIRGNSGWGRVIYELTDETGQRWISIGAPAAGEANRWLLDWMPPELLEDVEGKQACDWNTNDVFCRSYINFDGWRYVAFPLPGNYEGEQHPWPANSQWYWDGDGVVHYPLKLKRIIVEIPEKVLHVDRFEPVDDPSILFRDVTVDPWPVAQP